MKREINSMDKFMELIKNTSNDKLPGLVQKYVPPMCTTEITTRGILLSFNNEIKNIYTPIIANLQTELMSQSTTSVQLTEKASEEVGTLQKIIIVVGHIAKVVPWKKPYGECVSPTLNSLIIPVLKLKPSNPISSLVDIRVEAFETITKFIEVYEMQTNSFLPVILPFLEAHFHDVLDGKTKRSKEASDLLGIMLQSSNKLFVPSSLVSLLKVSIVLFFSHDDPTSKIEQLDVIGHITKKLLNITKSVSSPSPSFSPSLSSPSTPSSNTSSSPTKSPVPSLSLSSLPSSSPSLTSLTTPRTPREPEFEFKSAVSDFPYKELDDVSQYLATRILPEAANLEFWFESSAMALAYFSGISARTGDLKFHQKILDLTMTTYTDQLSKIKHTTKSERQYNILLMQALSLAVDLSDKAALQTYLPNFYTELRKINLASKGPTDSKVMRQYFQKLRSLIIRAIASVIKAMQDFTPMADQFLRETAKELADPIILADFVEALGPNASEYLSRVVKPLFKQLEKDTVSLKLKQVIIDTITRIIKLTQKDFLPYLQECAEILRPLASFSLVTDSCLPFVSLYSTILISFCEYPQIDTYVPLILPTFLDILNQSDALQSGLSNNGEKETNEETEAMDLSPLTICEVLSNLRHIFSNPQLTQKVLSICPTFLPELLIYLMDHIPTEIIFEEDSFIRVAQLEFIQQLLDSVSKEEVQMLSPLVGHILQNIELNTNEIDVQVASFETLAKFAKFESVPLENRERVAQVCDGSKFMAEDHKELKGSIERVLLALGKL